MLCVGGHIDRVKLKHSPPHIKTVNELANVQEQIQRENPKIHYCEETSDCPMLAILTEICSFFVSFHLYSPADSCVKDWSVWKCQDCSTVAYFHSSVPDAWRVCNDSRRFVFYCLSGPACAVSMELWLHHVFVSYRVSLCYVKHQRPVFSACLLELKLKTFFSTRSGAQKQVRQEQPSVCGVIELSPKQILLSLSVLPCNSLLLLNQY